MECAQTQAWLDACLACNYLTKEKFEELNLQCDEVSRLLNYMINHPEKFQ